jgi:hypothetical protein
MIDDLKKSFNEIIYERTTSPFYGTIITSWLIWNWRIIYLTFFVSEKKIDGHKINYILDNYSDIEHILIFPLISTILLITIFPFLSNGAFWLSLKFNKWKVDEKNKVDNKQLLTLEQSISLREEISKQEERFGKLVENKNLEIAQLQSQLEEYKNNKPTALETVFNSAQQDAFSDIKKLAERIKTNQKELNQYEKVLMLIQVGYQLTERSDVEVKFIALLESYDVIENKVNGVYKFTDLGKKLQKLMLE